MATAALNSSSLLPAQLMSFFIKYPPQKYSAYATGQIIPTIKQRIKEGAKPLSATTVPQSAHVLNNLERTTQVQSESLPIPPTTEPFSKLPPNPFLPYKNPSTGRWAGARIGLRRQAILFKMARTYGVEELLPPSIKSTDYKQRRALERGLAVKGTGEGQSVKGHKWERQKGATLEKRRKAMEEMPEMIRLWKQRGHGRGWKAYPK